MTDGSVSSGLKSHESMNEDNSVVFQHMAERPVLWILSMIDRHLLQRWGA